MSAPLPPVSRIVTTTTSTNSPTATPTTPPTTTIGTSATPSGGPEDEIHALRAIIAAGGETIKQLK